MSLPTPSKIDVLVDYSPVALDEPSGLYYSDVTKREWFTAKQLEDHKVSQLNAKAAELVRDSQIIIATADAELEWINNVV